jgi:hypothetical protein
LSEFSLDLYDAHAVSSYVLYESVAAATNEKFLELMQELLLLPSSDSHPFWDTIIQGILNEYE